MNYIKNSRILLILLAAALPYGNIGAESLHVKDDWKFENFGNAAKGAMELKGNEMTISTQNTKNAFFEADEYSFAYQVQPFLHDDCSRTVVTVKIVDVPKGSAGIMIRSSDSRGASNVHLEVTNTGDLFVFFRAKDGLATSYKRVGNVSFPVEVRLTRQGSSFLSHYKNRQGEWVKGPTVFTDLGDSHLLGFYACSGNDNQIGYDVETFRQMQVTFKDWNIEYSDNYIPAEKNFIDREEVAPNTLLRENFADGSLNNTPESIINPIWDGIRYAELPRTDNGSRYWRKRGDGIYYLGDKKWGDYEVAIRFSFPTPVGKTSEFMVQTRYQNIAIYEKMLKYYGVSLRNGNKVIMNKYKSGGNTVEPIKCVTVQAYDDGSVHELKIRVKDMDYEILLDGKTIISGTDAMAPITYGNLGLKFVDCDMNICRIEVREIKDEINGNADNILLDYYDEQIPSYIKQYER